mmetsp:Transcript_35964/g.58012  ORF Transcript_35964/g.58012 Transcript_35964/m.58012 type:complete len:351 (-) Transcript_35964:302-1354(-)
MCFLVGATGGGVTSSGEALLGGVSDDPYLFRTFVQAALGPAGHIATELRYVRTAEDLPPPFEWEPGQPGRCVNAAGLAFTVALAVELESAESATAVPFATLCRRMMTECSSVDGAVAVLLGAGRVTPAFSVLLADAAGDLAQVEVGAFGCALHQRYSKDKPGIVVAVNCYQCQELSSFNKAEAHLAQTTSNNGARLQRGWELAELYKGRIDVAVLASILSDHRHRGMDCASNPLIPYWGHSICNHGTRSQAEYQEAAAPWGTVSAEILQPSLRTLHYCYGWPCGERAEFGDQLFQNSSWGRFVGFALPKPGSVTRNNGAVFECTTVDGRLTEEGEALRCKPLIEPSCSIG